MQLDESYDILELTQREGIVVSRARERKTGKLVQIHLFPNEKIPEASQICARIHLSLPGEARSKVLQYGQSGNSPYFITEPLPEGEGLGEWVLRMAAPQASARPPEVSGAAVGNLRRMDIEPAPLQPLPPGPASRRTLVEQDPLPNPAPPGASAGPRTRPTPSAGGAPEPTPPGLGEFNPLYAREEIQTPRRPSPDRLMPPSPPASSMLSTPTELFNILYGKQDSQTPEPADLPENAPAEVSARSQVGPGLETFIGPDMLPPRGAPPDRAESPTPAPSETRPVFPEPSAERIPPPTRITRQTFTFPVPPPQPPVREPAELFSSPPPPPPAQPAPQPIVRHPAAPETRPAPAPLFSARVAAVAALGLMAVAAIVALIVEIWG